MQLKLSLVCAALLPLGAAMALCQQPATDPLPQMPGAPGQPTKTLSKPTVGTAVQEPTAADFEFMQGMVMHHSQAVEMVGLMKGRTQNPELLDLGKRIRISQGDEILFMKRWLAVYGKSVPADGGMAGMPGMAGMDHSKMNMDMPAMPGMLSAKQMDALRKAQGPEFDRLFLTGMIQHHTGALTMVKELFETQGSGQEPLLFDFTADVDVTQRGEIDMMQNMLAKEKQ
jgi:uncharacterized protein (DUF305 family)